MKNLFVALVATALLMAGGATAQTAKIAIVPKPAQIVTFETTATLTGQTPVYIDAKSGLSRDLAASVLKDAGIDPVFVAKAKKAKIVLKLNKTRQSDNDEAYRLAVMSPDSKNRIVATADNRAGLLYALQSLRQMTEPAAGGVSLPGCIVTDAPAFPWRAFMLDESRHFHGMQTVKTLLDEMARLKMNTFHWHLVDDQGWRIEIKKYPRLTEVASKRDFDHMNSTAEEWDAFHPTPAFYTQDEIKEVIRYADERSIRIIPEIEVPGHASSPIFAYPWVGTTSAKEGKAVVGDLYNVTDPKVEGFLHDVLDEVVALFPSKIVHIGGDEANYAHWQNSPDVQAFMKANGIPTCSDLQVWAINRMSNYLASKGCQMIGWNEITGDNVRGEAHVQASQSEKLAPGTLVQFWDGDIGLVNKAIEKGYDVVNSNRFFTYLDYPYEVTPFEKIYSFNPIPEGLADKDKAKILGSGCQMWCEFVPNFERICFQVFPRIAAHAECGWTPADRKLYSDFRQRLGKIESVWKDKGYLKTQLDKY